MAVLVIMEIDKVTAEEYDAVREAAVKQNPVDGGILAIAGPVDGGWRIIMVWESRADFDEFSARIVRPIQEAMGIPDPRIEIAEVHDLIIPALGVPRR